MKKIIIPILILLFCVASISAQGRGRSSLSYVPSKSVAVLQVNWQSVRNDETLKNIVQGESFINIADYFGIKENVIREFIVFVDVNPTVNNKMGLLVSGNFTKQSIIDLAKSRELESEQINGETAYINPTDNSYFLPIKNGMLLAGTKNGVSKTLETVTNPKTGLINKKNFSSIFNQFGRTSPIKFFIGVPQEYQKVADYTFKVATKLMSFTSLGLMGTIFDKIGLIQSLGFSVSSMGNTMPIQLIADMPSTTKATVGATALNWFKSLSLRTNTTPQNKTALNSLTVGNTGKLLSVKFSMPKSALVTR